MTGEQANGPGSANIATNNPPARSPYPNTIAQYFGTRKPATEQDVQNRFMCHDILNRAYRDLEKLLPPGPETTTCFRKLLEAKDCALRAAAPNAH